MKEQNQGEKWKDKSHVTLLEYMENDSCFLQNEYLENCLSVSIDLVL